MPSRIKTTLPNTEFEIATGNFDTSRKAIDQIIIHTTVSSAQSAMAHFDDPNAKVSAHYIVGLDGTIYHGLEETFTAYHAGDYAVNQRSIGIEHEDNGDFNGVRPDALYTSSAKLVRDICNFYNIPIDRSHILKHSEVHATGCPDSLDIDRIVREAAGTTTVPMVTLPQSEVDQLRFDRDKNWKLYQDTLVELNVANALIEQQKIQIEKLIIENEGFKHSTSETANSIPITTVPTTTPVADSNPPASTTTPNNQNVHSQTTSGGITDTSVSSFFKALLAWLRGK